jgi:hypothetical protein
MIEIIHLYVDNIGHNINDEDSLISKSIKYRGTNREYNDFFPQKFLKYLEEKILLRLFPIKLTIEKEKKSKSTLKRILSDFKDDLISFRRVFDSQIFNIDFSLGIERDYENGTIYCLTIKHPNERFDGNIVKEVLTGRIRRMKGELKRIRKTKKKDADGNIIKDENGKKIIQKRVIDVDPYESIPRFIYIKSKEFFIKR